MAGLAVIVHEFPREERRRVRRELAALLGGYYISLGYESLLWIDVLMVSERVIAPELLARLDECED